MASVSADLFFPNNCSPATLEQFKQKFATIINSKRKLGKVQNIEQLKRLLIKRDEISIEILTNNPLTNRVYEEKKISNIEFQNTPNPKRANLDKVYSIIKDDIGHEWKEFARGLEVPEGRIDEWTLLPGNERLHKVLLHHELNCLPHCWRENLLEALQKARRRDLQRKVSQVLNFHNIIQPQL